MVRLGRRCTRNIATIQNTIQDSVARAVASAHSMLNDDTSSVADMNQAAKGWRALRRNDDAKMMTLVLDSVEQLKLCIVPRDAEGQCVRTNRKCASVPQNDAFASGSPPKDAFASRSSWVLGGSGYNMSSSQRTFAIRRDKVIER